MRSDTLCQLKLMLLRDPEFSNPYYWCSNRRTSDKRINDIETLYEVEITSVAGDEDELMNHRSGGGQRIR